MANIDLDVLHKDLQKMIRVLENRNKIESDRNKLLRKYLESTISESPNNIDNSNDQRDFIEKNFDYVDYVNQVVRNHVGMDQGLLCEMPCNRNQ